MRKLQFWSTARKGLKMRNAVWMGMLTSYCDVTCWFVGDCTETLMITDIAILAFWTYM